MYKSILSIFIFIISFYSVSSQNLNYSVLIIPDSLKKDANVVIRYIEEDLNILNKNKATLNVRKAITILKKSGEEHAKVLISYNSFKEVNSITCKIYDKFGKFVKKIGKKDIFDIAAFDGYSLYNDIRYKYIKKPALNPPYTIELEYELTYKGLYSLPDRDAFPDFNVSVEHAIFEINAPSDVKFFTKEINCENVKSLKFENENSTYSERYEIKSFKAIKKEPFNNQIKDYFPIVLIRLSDFDLGGYYGNSDTWENLGKWENQLLQGRDIIPDETRNKILGLVRNVESDLEKAKLIYKYMQSKTRYVSIQKGIGGMQPFLAETVDETGYGDCKALSYYTMSLLKIAGIKSYYSSVYAGRNYSPLIKDFPSHQSNHVILCVPFEKDTIWLECTSQTAPFGYIGTFTDDRDVLIIDSDGKGKIAHTTVYPEEVNTQFRYAEIDLDETGSISSKIKTVYAGLQYENVWRILDLSEEEKEKKLNERIALPNMKIKKFSFVNNKNIIPSVAENLKIDVKNYASVSSNRIFLIPNILNRKGNIPRKIKDRKTDIVFRRGFTDADTIIYNIPEGFNLEYLPENIKESNKFGSYEVSYHFENSKLTYIRKRIIHKGTFPPEKYEDLRSFYKLMYNADKKAIVFVKGI
ncbi:MAG: DUF3857 domain-containing protein [Bacteroidales bacterium]|nr:DUF3857 domain-containing protein [Bacteroidales bacterium]